MGSEEGKPTSLTSAQLDASISSSASGETVSLSAFLAGGRAALVVVGVWVGAGFVLDELSGWSRLRRVYPDKPEPALRSLGFQSGWMGSIQFRGILSLSACLTGLRLGQVRILSPLSRGIMVPWSEIYAQHVPGLFGAKAQLSFGNDAGSLRINAASWEALVAVARERPTYDEPRDAKPALQLRTSGKGREPS